MIRCSNRRKNAPLTYSEISAAVSDAVRECTAVIFGQETAASRWRQCRSDSVDTGWIPATAVTAEVFCDWATRSTDHNDVFSVSLLIQRKCKRFLVVFRLGDKCTREVTDLRTESSVTNYTTSHEADYHHSGNPQSFPFSALDIVGWVTGRASGVYEVRC